MSSPEDYVPPPELLRSLLHAAGVHDAPHSVALLGVSTCSVCALTAGGQRYVVRHRLDGEAQMARKEAYLSELLRRHGVPAPVVLTVVADEHGVATLSYLLPGVRLDRAMERLSAPDLHGAWRSTGEALRLAHEIILPEAGEIVGDRVEPFPGGWARWVLEDLVDDVRWLLAALGGAPVNLALLERVHAAAVDALEDAPVRLVHNDALPQNVLVAPGPDGWTCTGWLDWEFARGADPLWDIGTLDFRPAGLVPPAFYEGYGRRPSEPQASIYDLLMATWRTRVELQHGTDWCWPPRQARINYFGELPRWIDRLVELLGVGG